MHDVTHNGEVGERGGSAGLSAATESMIPLWWMLECSVVGMEFLMKVKEQRVCNHLPLQGNHKITITMGL